MGGGQNPDHFFGRNADWAECLWVEKNCSFLGRMLTPSVRGWTQSEWATMSVKKDLQYQTWQSSLDPVTNKQESKNENVSYKNYKTA